MDSKLSLESALKKLERSPTSALLLRELWPAIKDFDFSKNQVLEVPMPYHRVWNGKRNCFIPVPYSHSAIRKALYPLRLEPVGLHGNKETIKMKQKKCAHNRAN